MNRPLVRARRLAGLGLLALLPLALALGLATTSAGPAQAASAGNWNAGNIIADSVFFNSQTMSQAGVQAFLQAKEPTCASGYTCLRSYTQDTWTRAADAQCASYVGVPAEPASAIIWKTAQACGVNPMVLLVLLQKESSLVTASAPSSGAYLHATGYGCPDTAPCDAQYYGFYNQVYKAAWQYKRYTNNPTSYSYQAGRNNYVQYNPNSGCGGSTVYIQNNATAALYIYTPYQPDAAALNNLYGLGDSCSAYGNRNFWRMFTDWFGSTQVSFGVYGAILAEYDARGDSSGVLGDAIGDQYPTAGGGWSQAFENGSIHWSPATGAHAVAGAIAAEYHSRGAEGGPLGYPTGDEYATPAGWDQAFQNGRIHFSFGTGAHAVIGAISAEYQARGGEAGVLGYPTGDEYTTPWGWDQPFQNGRIHFSPATGAHAVTGAISALYDSMVGEVGPLGYPVADEYATPGGWDQAFENGRIHFSFATGAHSVIGPLSTLYDGMLGEAGPLGYPVAERYATPGGGWAQSFQSSRVHWSSATGAHSLVGALSTAYDARQGEAGSFGYPVAEQYATVSGGVAQAFQNGTLVIAADATVREVAGEIGAEYAALGGAAGGLGEPTGDRAAWASTGLSQPFQHGRIVDGPTTGAHALIDPTGAAYDSLGGPSGALGRPVEEQSVASTGTTVQRFEHGLLVVGSTGAHTVLGVLAQAWTGTGGPTGPLGDPTAQVTTASGSPQQSFAGGYVLDSPATGTHALVGAIATAYTASGGPDGPLGYPVTDRYPTAGNGWTQGFEHGRIHSSPATGAHAVIGALSAAYDGVRGEAGPLGYPVTDRYPTAGGGWTQAFQFGRIHSSPTTGAHAVIGALSAAYDGVQGEAGPLGYPVTDRYPTAGNGWTQGFEHGRIHSSPTTGAHAVIGALSAAYDGVQGEAGPLGYPVTDRYPTAGGGWTQAFQFGRIHSSPTTGAHAVIGALSAAYDGVQGEAGPLGYPVTDRYPTAGNGWTQGFEHGRIHSSPATGAHAVIGALSAAYDGVRGEAGPLGYPVTDRYPTAGGGWTQAFQFGRIHSSPTTGAHAVIGALSAAYDGVQGEAGPLGYPVTDQVGNGAGVVSQTFQRGTISQNPGAAPVVRIG